MIFNYVSHFSDEMEKSYLEIALFQDNYPGGKELQPFFGWLDKGQEDVKLWPYTFWGSLFLEALVD